MPSANERQRNNVRMGIFVSVSLLLALGVLVALTDAVAFFRTNVQQHTVRFSVQAGVGNLRPGSDVRVGGMKLGEVTVISPQFGSDSDGPFRFIDVHFKLDSNVTLYDNATLLVSSPIIGAESWLDVQSVGEGNKPARGILTGSERLGMLTTLLGPESAAQAQQMIADSTAFTEFLASFRDEYNRNLQPTLENMRTASSDLQQLMDTVRRVNWPHWANMIDALLVQTQSTATELDRMIGQGHGLLTDGREVMAENRSDVRATVDNVRAGSANWREAASRINTETIDRVHALLDTGQGGLDEAVTAMQTIRTDYDAWATALTEAMGRANLASQQLHLTMTEVRRSPWKVLYRPSEKELEHELLYEAARSFAVAAADLKAASTAMQRVLDTHSEVLAIDELLLQRVTNNLLEPLERYEIAQQRLLDVLFTDR